MNIEIPSDQIVIDEMQLTPYFISEDTHRGFPFIRAKVILNPNQAKEVDSLIIKRSVFDFRFVGREQEPTPSRFGQVLWAKDGVNFKYLLLIVPQASFDAHPDLSRFNLPHHTATKLGVQVARLNALLTLLEEQGVISAADRETIEHEGEIEAKSTARIVYEVEDIDKYHLM